MHTCCDKKVNIFMKTNIFIFFFLIDMILVQSKSAMVMIINIRLAFQENKDYVVCILIKD